MTCHSNIYIKNNPKCFEKELKLKLIPFRENCEYIRKIAFKNFEITSLNNYLPSTLLLKSIINSSIFEAEEKMFSQYVS